MKKTDALAVCVIASLLPTTVIAENTYGGAEFSFGTYSVEDTGDDEGTGNLTVVEGFIGTELASGIFVEGEARVERTSSLSDPGQNNGLREGDQVAFRLGKDFGGLSLEAFVGAVSAVSGDNDDPGDPEIERQFLGVIAGYDVSDSLRVSGLIGRLDGDTTISNQNLDAFYEFNHVALALNYDVTDHWTLGGQLTLGRGEMDGDADTGTARELMLSATRTFADPNMRAYVEYRHAYYEQPAESDDVTEDHFGVGFSWTFGTNGAERQRDRMALPNYSEWLAVSDGGLE